LIPRTPSIQGTFLLSSPTYFQQIYVLALAIINLELDLIINLIILMGMLDFDIRGDSFVVCVEDHSMLYGKKLQNRRADAQRRPTSGSRA
jgi:hypothetical protein